MAAASLLNSCPAELDAPPLDPLQRRGLTFRTRVSTLSSTVEHVESAFEKRRLTYIDGPNSELSDRQHSLQQHVLIDTLT